MTHHRSIASLACIGLLLAVFTSVLDAHGVSGKDAVYLQGLQGRAIIPLMYLGAKHMVTGYDHLLFLVGVIFFLFRLRQIALYVSLFSLGHSITLLAGVFSSPAPPSALRPAFFSPRRGEPHLVDAVIGLSVAYKAFENLGGFITLF